MWFQKISILPPQKGLEIPGRRGVSKSQKFKAIGIGISGGVGGGGHRANPFLGGDMDTFWNHTMYIFVQRLLRLSQFGRKIRLNLLL